MAERDACLHLLMPERRIAAAWEQCRRALGDKDGVILLAGGCPLTRLSAVVDEAGRRPVYAVTDELRALGLDAAAPAPVVVIDWPELVELCTVYALSRTWT